MPTLSAKLRELLIQTELFVFPEDFVVVHLPKGHRTISAEWFHYATTRFAIVIQEPKMITMVIPRRRWLRMQNMFEKYEANGPWKVISLKVKQLDEVMGYLATIESVLKDSKISHIPVSTLKNNHVLVPKSDLPRAVRVLRDFLENCEKKKKPKA